MTTTLLVGKLIDGTGAPPLTNARLTLDHGQVIAIDQFGPQDSLPSDHLHDYRHTTALPGFIDLHAHYCYPVDDGFQTTPHHLNRIEMVALGFQSAQNALREGVTTARVLGTHFDLDFGLRDVIEGQPSLGPRLLAAGRMMTMTGGRRTPWDYLKDEVTGAAEARRWARAHLARGADLIKLYCTTLLEEDVAKYLQRKHSLPDGAPDPGHWGCLTVEEIRATVNEAHRLGRTVSAHTAPAFGIKAALRGGVDTIEHGSELDDECIEVFLDTGATLVPTLAVSQPGSGPDDDSPRAKLFRTSARHRWEQNKMRVHRAYEAGVRIGTGTDNVRTDMHFWSEVELLAEVGLSPMEAIRCATQHAACCLGEAGRQLGTLQPGKCADIVLLAADPLRDIRHIREVVAVFKAGELVSKSTAPALPAQETPDD